MLSLRKKISIAAGNRAAGLLIKLRLYQLLAAWTTTGAREWLPDGSVVRFRPDRRPDLPLVLVLQADRMPADIRILAQSPKFRVLSLDEPWLSRIVYRFLPPGLGFSFYVVRDPIEPVRIGRARLRAFLRKLLPHIYRRIPVSVLLRTDIKLQSDFDWCGVSAEMGIPYVVLQRENAIASGRLAKFADRDAATLFEGDHIIAYGQSMCDHYVRSGIARPDQVSALGCMRMDALIARLRSAPDRVDGRRITVFAIEPEVIEGRGPEVETMYRQVHAELFLFAHDHPDVDVVFKLKKQRAKGRYVSNMRERILAAATSDSFDIASLCNVSFTTDGDAQDHIMNSNIIIGLNSTTVLEAAVAGKPVIMPVFESMRTSACLAQIDYAEDLEAFDVPRDRGGLRAMLERRLSDARIAPDMVERRWRLFERYFGSRQGDARERIAAKLFEIAGVRSPGVRSRGNAENAKGNVPRADVSAPLN